MNLSPFEQTNSEQTPSELARSEQASLAQVSPESCARVQGSFSEYLDGAVGGYEMLAIATHLRACPPCDQEFTTWREMQRSLASLRALKAPADLGLKLRVAISQQKARQNRTWADRFAVRWENALRPMLIQVSAGLAGTIVLVGTIAMLVGMVAAPEAVMAHDVPLGAMTAPHYLYSAASQRAIVTDHETTIVVDAAINARGQVYDYKLLSGPESPEVQKQIAEQLLLSVFTPASVFGSPVRGHVILTFAGITVHA
jgi:anti-sigma factor RsiW